MIYELVPTELHDEFKAFHHDLEKITSQHVQACPFCKKTEFYLIRSKPTKTYRCKDCHKYFTVSTNTPFNRLMPFNWLELIFTSRIKNISYLNIAKKLESSLEKVMRRDRAIIHYLQIYYPSLHKWYTHQKQTALMPTLAKQHQNIKAKVTALLNEQSPTCIHCGSNETTKVGSRTCYRCKRCRHSFNILSNTSLNRIPKPELWLQFIDLLVSGANNLQIRKALNLHNDTVRKWRSAWYHMMKDWHYEALATWCKNK
jgi:transposase-like protein